MATAGERKMSPSDKEEEKKEEKDGMVYMWQGYHGSVEVVRFRILSERTVKRVAIGGDHSLFCTEVGEVFACGSNKHGQLGVESLESDYAYDPIIVQSLNEHKVTEIACGVSHSAAVTDDGLCFCWGLNNSLQCGQENEEVNKPSEVNILIDSGNLCAHGVSSVDKVTVREVACGWSHTLVLSSDGEIWGWGNGEGLGLESVKETAKPILLEAFVGRNVLSICSGHFHSLALLEKSLLSDVNFSTSKSKSRLSIETKTHKHYPSTCSMCNAEIYTYSETNDTCIITEEHQCDKKDFDVSLSESEMGLQVDSQTPCAKDSDRSDKDNVDQSEVRDKDDKLTDPSGNEGEEIQENDKNMIGNTVDMADGDEHTESSVKERQSEGDGDIDQENNDNAHRGNEDQKLIDSDQSMHKKQGTNKLSSSITKSGSFIDEKEARKYLAGQYEDKDSEEQVEKSGENVDNTSSQASFLGSILSSVQSYPTDMMQQVSTVTSMTTKAISNLADRLNFTQGQPEAADSKSDSSSFGSNLHLATLDTSDEEMHHVKTPAEAGANTDTENGGISGSSGHLSESSFIEQNLPVLDTTKDDVFQSPERKSLSIRTIQVKQEKLERRSSESLSKTEADKETYSSTQPVITIETEVWSWGKNSSGQLGVGDQVSRSFPVPVKVLDSANIVKIRAGRNHSIAITADSHAYTWGDNDWGQLGHSEESSKPNRIKLMSGCYIWDADAGNTYSVYLVDRAGFQPEVHYVGKHPCRDLYVPIYKSSRLTALPFLKQAGWIRSVSAGGDNCAVLSCFSFSGFTGTLFEVAATERRFYQHLNRIKRLLVIPLSKSSFYTALDVYPYKSCMQNLLSAFTRITNMIGECSIEMSSRICRGDNFLDASFFTNYSRFVDQFKRYSVNYSDMVAIGGFEYFCKTGSSVFAKMEKIFNILLEDSSLKKKSHAAKLQIIFCRPFSHLKEYCRMAEKLSCNYPLESDEYNMLNRVSLHWDSLRHISSNNHGIAENTRKFWEHYNFPKLVDAVKLPSRRLIRDSKTKPVSLQGGGRMSVNNFFLFNDLFVHAQYSTFQAYPLETLWVEIPSNEEKKQNLIILTMPEEKLSLVAPSPAEKAEWLMALNSSINKVLASQKSVKRRGSTERLTPPDVRQATHGFTKHGSYKDATYSGYWMNGKLHGFGEMKWNDGRRYRGNFKNGQQHGYGRLTIRQDDGGERTQEGHWSEGQLHGIAKVRYSNGDTYDGYFKEGQRHGHGIYRKGQHTSSAASVFIGEWNSNKKQGYGILDDVLKGEKYMGMWHEDVRHGGGIMVTLDGMYFEGTFSHDKLMGHGLMLTYDNSCYEGDFCGITQLSGKNSWTEEIKNKIQVQNSSVVGRLTMPNGDYIEGYFTGSWNEGLKINGTFYKCHNNLTEKRSSQSFSQISRIYGTMCVPAERRWERLFTQCCTVLGYKRQGQPNTKKAWDNVAVMLSVGKKNIVESEKSLTSKNRHQLSRAEDLEKIPPHSCGTVTIEYYNQIKSYLQKAFEVSYHPLGKLLEGLVDVFRAAYIGVGAHPRLLNHAVKEIKSYITRLYFCVRILFPDLPANGGPQHVKSENSTTGQNNASKEFERQNSEEEEEYEVLSSGELLFPLLLPKIYPPLFDLYALYNDKEDEKYWERVKKLNKQGDIGLMAYLGVDQKFWLLDVKMFTQKGKSISNLRDHCFTSSVETLQQISTAFSPKEKLEVIKQTFLDITETVKSNIGEEHVWCMDELFPIFQYVVVRAQLRHLGAEIHLIQDLMERHLENGELGIMFTTLHACYFQIQHEKIPNH